MTRQRLERCSCRPATPEVREARTGSPAEEPQGAWPCWPLDCRFLGFRNVTLNAWGLKPPSLWDWVRVALAVHYRGAAGLGWWKRMSFGGRWVK